MAMSPFELSVRSACDSASGVGGWPWRVRGHVHATTDSWARTLAHAGSHPFAHALAHSLAHSRVELSTASSWALPAELLSTHLSNALVDSPAHGVASAVTHIAGHGVKLCALRQGQHIPQILARFQLRDLCIGLYAGHAIEGGARFFQTHIALGCIDEIGARAQHVGLVERWLRCRLQRFEFLHLIVSQFELRAHSQQV